MFNVSNLPDGTMVRFLDMPAVQYPPLTEEQNSQCESLYGQARELAKNVNVSGFTVVEGKLNERVQVQMSRTTLDKINAIAKGEQ
ncbi:hypothetical protein pEaSNUABM18_00335 [Erwinia phage pEa_SNUABM_18]|nr:hypothetical protein pEaSNUABM18_00335 [Erwinia phage pEa_SNUABM_18]